MVDYTSYISNWYKNIKESYVKNILKHNPYNTSIVDLKSLVSNYYFKIDSYR